MLALVAQIPREWKYGHYEAGGIQESYYTLNADKGGPKARFGIFLTPAYIQERPIAIKYLTT